MNGPEVSSVPRGGRWRTTRRGKFIYDEVVAEVALPAMLFEDAVTASMSSSSLLSASWSELERHSVSSDEW